MEEGNSSEMDEADILSRMPVEIAQKVFEYLNPADLCRTSETCRRWRSLVNTNHLWRPHCLKHDWRVLDMVTDFRTHHYKIQEDICGLEKKCAWWLNYQRHAVLPRNWESNRSINYQISVVDSGVTCIHCDGRTLAVGHAQGIVTVFDIRGLPQYKDTVTGALSNYRVLDVKTNSEYILLVQSMLLQIYRFEEDCYVYLGAKSFELGPANIELSYWQPPSGDEFQTWYKERVGGDRLSRDWVTSKGVFFDLFDGRIYASARDSRMVYVWRLDRLTRVTCLFSSDEEAKLRDLVLAQGGLYAVFGSGRARRITAFDPETSRRLYELSARDSKTEKLLVSGNLLVAVGVAGPALVHNGVISVWNRCTGQIIASKATSEYISYRQVAISHELVLYSEATLIRVWDPVQDTVIKQFSTEDTVVYLKPTPFRFVVVYTHSACHVWDWLYGTKLYRLHTELQWMGDYTRLLWLDQTMILSKGAHNTVLMTGYC